MIVYDTNVISELLKSQPASRVVNWVAAQSPSKSFITVTTEAELRVGVAILPAGQRQIRLAEAMAGMIQKRFAGRVLPFDSAAAQAYADVVAERRRAGKPISQSDAQISAIVRTVGAILATRNTTDFQGCGFQIINPWME